MKKTWTPFTMTALGWLALSIGWVALGTWPNRQAYFQNLLILSGIWMLCLLNLLSLVKTIAGLGNARVSGLQTAFWGAVKFFSLGFLVAMIYLSKSKSMPITLVLGISTCLVVPVVGGTIWNTKEFWNAR